MNSMEMTIEIDSCCENDGVKVFTSLDGHFAVSDALSQLLSKAQNRLLISSPWVGKGFIDLIRRTVPDGISISILTRLPKESYDNSFDALASLFELAEAHRWKIEIRCTSKHHPKFIIVDDTSCLAGSLNPTESGIYYNLELGFIITNSALIRRVTDFFFKMHRMSTSWQKVTQFHGLETVDPASVENKIAERYIGIFLGNGNTPLPKWKSANVLKSLGFEDKDIIKVENYLLKQGTLYEPRIDWVCLACAPD